MKLLVAREFAPRSIIALAAHILMSPLRPFRLTAKLYSVMSVLALVGLSLMAVSGIAQTPESPAEDGGPVLTAESGLVVVPLHVYKNRKSVGGLDEQEFELVEDGAVQDIAFVDGPGGRKDPAKQRIVPIEIILLVDAKNTARIDLLDTRKARGSFFEGVADNVAISVYGFTDKLRRITGPTRDIAKVQIAFEIAYSSGAGHIPILDAIVATARDAATRTRNAARKLVVFSGGLNRRIFGAGAHSALDFETPVYDIVVSHQEPVISHQEPVIGRRRISGYSAWYIPVLLGRPESRAHAGTRERSDSRNQKPRSVPAHQCCPFGMEISRVHKQMGLDAPYRANARQDWKHNKSMWVRAYLKSLARLAQNEYFVSYYPSRRGDEPVARQVEIRLKSKRIGQLYGGKRVIVY